MAVKAASSPIKRSMTEMIWRRRNETKEDIVQYEQDNPEPFITKPGEVIILRKQRQLIRMMMKYDCTLYGGAMGGGKSYIGFWAMVWFCFYCYSVLGVKKVHVAIFCESINEVQERHIAALPKYLPDYTIGKLVGMEFRLAKWLGGGIIKYKNIDPKRVHKLRSIEIAAAFIDELTLIDEHMFEEVWMRLRWAGVPHCPLIAATNPGGKGHQWVMHRFVDPETRDKPKWIPAKKRWSKGHYFIQCLPQENPFLETDYWTKLTFLSEKKRRALVEGDWSIFDGQFFSSYDRNVHVIPTAQIPEDWPRFRAMDKGRVHPWVCLWGAINPATGQLVVYREYSVVGHSASWHKPRIAQLSGSEEYVLTVGPHDMKRKEGSQEGDRTAAEIFNTDDEMHGDSFEMVFAGKDRKERIEALVDAMSFEYETIRDERGLETIRVVRPPDILIMDCCKYLCKSITNVIHDDRDPDVYKHTNATRPGAGDDEVDTLALLLQYATGTMDHINDNGNEPEQYQYHPQRDFGYAESETEFSYAAF